MRNSTGNADKKSRKTDQKDKKKERKWNMQEQKGKDNSRKNNSTTQGNKPESTGERKKIKEISTKGNTIQTKQDIPKQLDAKETKRFWTKIWQPKIIN